MFVRGVSLVEQASQRLFREGISHGVIQGSHWNKNYNAPISLCSIDTLIARGERPPADLIVIDEAHLATSDKYKEVLNHYSRSYIVAVTATPFTRDSMEHLAEAIVHPVTMQGLIELGYLVPARYYAPSTPDLKGVRTVNGDYVLDQLQDRMAPLTGDIVQHWKQLSENRPTICFAVNIQHSLALVEQFRSAGIGAEHIEAKTSQKERNEAIQRLKDGKIKVLSNVGILCTGVDLPFVSCLLMARPTQSYNLYVQQAGRGTRISPETGKKDFIILDHAGNVLRHGLIQDEPEVELAGIKVEYRGPQMHTCEKCYTIFTGEVCHACSAIRIIPPSTAIVDLEVEDGILESLRELPKAAEISLFIRRQKELAKRRGYHHRYVYHKVREAYGDDVADAAFPSTRSGANVPWFLRNRA